LWVRTTGPEPSEGHRVVEIGAFRFGDDAAEGEDFHSLLNPDRSLDPEWSEGSGLTAELLSESPRFADIASALLEFCGDATVVLYDAQVAAGFLRLELSLWRDDGVVAALEDMSPVVDLRELAREVGAEETGDLASLCQRYAMPIMPDARHDALSQARRVAALYQAMTRAHSAQEAGGHSSMVRTIRIPDIAWIELPGGEFLYGDKREPRRVETFWIARYPVTNAQYQTFIDDGGYENARWWQKLERPEPAESAWPQPNRPRTDVSWYEAVAFCRWLSMRLGLGEDAVRLPTELEWERAARGTDGPAYPWGDDFQSGLANVDEPAEDRGRWYLRQTTAVGLYPQGRSPEGVEDMAGTVWEWCANQYDDPQIIAPDSSGAARVLRGGAWIYGPDVARADGRFRLRPGIRSGNIGFRLCCSVPIADR
jgi:DNA polymerase III epsilon subunit family exonuclease